MRVFRTRTGREWVVCVNGPEREAIRELLACELKNPRTDDAEYREMLNDIALMFAKALRPGELE